MAIYTPRKMGVAERAVARDKKERAQKPDYIYLNADEIVNHISFNLKSASELQRVLDLTRQSNKIHDKAVLLWEGCMRFKPFQEHNAVAALLIMDAFLRKNNMKLKCKGSMSDFADIYYWHIVKCEKGTVRGTFLDTMFHMINKKKTDDVWGFTTEYQESVEILKDNISKGQFTYEKNDK